ncbi:MAG: 1,4-alpha-glucan branching protein GlgB [Betaproteobacteria bacterium]|nr:1,4-alpha-glucan branching protein GlgB [Betaproteobacteria bacterium]
MTFSAADVEALRGARHPDPFAVLGAHRDADDRYRIRVHQPGATSLALLTPDASRPLGVFHQHPEDFFEFEIDAPLTDYRLRARWRQGGESIFDDPYRFPPQLSEHDLWLFGEGTLLRPQRLLGAEPCQALGVTGTRFAVWAPQAAAVSVVGDFNLWDERRHPMRRRHDAGVWEIFLPDVAPGALYKFALRDATGQSLGQKADPYARRAELRPATASVVAGLPAVVAQSEQRRHANAIDAPISIYEVHAASWRRRRGAPGESESPFADWDELRQTLIPYVKEMGFTHLELLPITEHPLDASWGYQPTGLYAPTARHGDPAAFRRFVAACHDAGLGVIVDWVPAHFPSDAHGLARFDGTPLYEYADRREGFHPDWNTLIYDFNRPQVRNFLFGSALHWLEAFGVDGLRVDAVASMLYRDYSRRDGEWLPNVHGGRENLEAIGFLRRLNEMLGSERPAAITVAEESTAFPQVSRPTSAGGLGFHYKWNMGWMNDTLKYMGRDPVHRSHHHDELTFGLVYAFSEQFVLPISHDEVVHGKGSLLARMPGDRWQRFANLRAYLGFMFAHPGKKLLFMGCEFAQEREWNHAAELDWSLLDDPMHAGVQRLVRDLNALLKSTAALHRRDFEVGGFEWIDWTDRAQSVIAFMRHGNAGEPSIVAVCNFTPTIRDAYRLGVPASGVYRERLNTDSEYYGGSNVGTPFGECMSEAVACHGRPQSIVLRLPPLATVFLELRR